MDYKSMNDALREFGKEIRAMDRVALRNIINSTNRDGELWVAAIAAENELDRRDWLEIPD